MTNGKKQIALNAIQEMLNAQISERNIVRHLMDLGYEPETGFWLIDQVKYK